MSKLITKQNADKYLYEIAKEYRKLNHRGSHAEIVLVGGGAIMLKHNFRNATEDFDVLIQGSISAIKEIANHVGDKNDLVYNWLNSDFSKTTSYSKELVLYSKFYKNFCGCLDIRIVPDEYLIAMKLVSGRKYKHDCSDVIGILMENIQTKTPITKEAIYAAEQALYKESRISNEMKDFLDEVFATEYLEDLYYQILDVELNNHKRLEELIAKHPELSNDEDKILSYLDGFKENELIENCKKENDIEEESDNLELTVF